MMIASLLEEKRRMQHSVVTIFSSDEVALFTKWKANQTSKSKSDEDSSKNVKCFYCEKIRHYKNRCLKIEVNLKSKKSTESDKEKEKMNLIVVAKKSYDEANAW
ncbi:hypothetical protein O6H91_12G019700 [Diphasiastrum complanatum]|uniref:Uncharacterized protein n=1 Tax=Diphasiastrum complanatum TaxID=34168 RepID=A0ACC2BZB6_DIPCM|nr:hypothetical protein O6H91_12G019700 [Diphasiastrum complanatum]